MENRIAEKPKKIRGDQKAAILLTCLDEETAANIFKHLSQTEIEKISSEIASLEGVHTRITEEISKEFFQLMKFKDSIAAGGIDRAGTILEKAVGTARAADIISRIRIHGRQPRFTILREADSRQIANFLIKEHPQTSALILSYLSPEQTAIVLSEFPEDLRTDVAYRIATMGKVSPDLLNEVEEEINALAEAGIFGRLNRTGGTKTLAAILNKADKNTEKSILVQLEEKDPGVAMEVRSKMFAFEDITHIDDRGIQKLLKNVDKRDLILALKISEEEVKEKIFQNMSERAALILKEDLEYLGPVRVQEAQKAQRKIIEIIKVLEYEGEIIIDGKTKEDEIIF